LPTKINENNCINRLRPAPRHEESSYIHSNILTSIRLLDRSLR